MSWQNGRMEICDKNLFFFENADPVKCEGFPLERMSFAGFLNEFSRKFVNGRNISTTAALFQTKIYTPSVLQFGMKKRSIFGITPLFV